MPTETRLINFTAAEVIEALTAFCAATKRPLPTGGARRLVAPDGEQSKYVLEPKGEGAPLSFYESEVAAALLAYCKKKRVPVARRATKALEAQGDTVVLKLMIE